MSTELKDFIATILTVAIGVAIGTAVLLPFRNAAPAAFGGNTDVVVNTVPVATSVWVGKDISTTLVASSTGRQYLEISNISGATSTSQALYCNVNGASASLYTAFVVHASSTKVFTLDNMYRGALNCRFPVASSTVTVVEY